MLEQLLLNLNFKTRSAVSNAYAFKISGYVGNDVNAANQQERFSSKTQVAFEKILRDCMPESVLWWAHHPPTPQRASAAMETQKIQSELHSDMQSSTEMIEPQFIA
jgi:hypothetical protein